MCTLAWGNRRGDLWACFNRDEHRERPQAEEPRLHEGPNGPVAYARDPEGGGTWFAASSCGFAVSLLNNYPLRGELPGTAPRSRGLLVTELAGCRSAANAFTRLAELRMEAYAAFHLFLLSGDNAVGMSWDGSRLIFRDLAEHFLSTSSFKPDQIPSTRLENWRNLPLEQSGNPDFMAAWMRRSDAENGAFGVAMDRPDARTVSQILLKSDSSGFRFLYYPRDPRGAGFMDPVEVIYRNEGNGESSG